MIRFQAQAVVRWRQRLSAQDDRVLPYEVQLGFAGSLMEADTDNKARVFDRKTTHLPGKVPEAVAYHRKQISDHHAAMLACDFETAMAIRNDAYFFGEEDQWR